jgi:hypothetical protein
MGRDSKGHFTSEGNEGRKAGTPNKTTTEIREAFSLLIENNLSKLQEDLNGLEPKDRVKLLLEMSQFVVPKLRSIDLKSDVEETITIDFNSEINWKSSDVIDFEEN